MKAYMYSHNKILEKSYRDIMKNKEAYDNLAIYNIVKITYAYTDFFIKYYTNNFTIRKIIYKKNDEF